MSQQNNINVGDHVRVLAGSHAGEIATVGNIMWVSNQFGSYARIHLTYEGGKVADRSMESVEKMNDKPGSAILPESNSHEQYEQEFRDLDRG